MILRLIILSVLFTTTVCTEAQAQLNGHTNVTTSLYQWSYIVFNDGPPNSPNYIGYYTLSVNAPIEVTGTPEGWSYNTDNSSYVSWYNTDTALPYPHDIAPGNSLDGFTIQSSVTTSEVLGYSLASWDHVQDAPGPDMAGSVLAPSVPTAVPEPSTITTFGIGALSLLLFAVRRRSKRTGRSI